MPVAAGGDHPARSDGAPPRTRRQMRAHRRRRSRGPILAGLALVMAAGAGSIASLTADPNPSSDGDTAAFPGAGESSAAPAELTRSPVPLVPPTASRSADVNPAAEKVAAAPRRISEVGGRAERTSGTWPALTYTLKASDTSEEPLRFPGAIIGFELTNSSVSRVTVTEGRYFTAVGDLPVQTASYDECRRHRFYARWMALDPSAVVEATFVDESVRTVQNRPVQGAAGWQSSFGCVQPALRIRTPAGTNPASADVLVETQVWRRR